MKAALVPTWLQEFEKEAGYMKPEDNTYYDPKKFALELGFSEHYAECAGKANIDATTLRNVAKAKRARGLMPDQQGKVEPQKKVSDADLKEGAQTIHITTEELIKPAVTVVKKHKHSYRKDGTCACGAVRKPKK